MSRTQTDSGSLTATATATATARGQLAQCNDGGMLPVARTSWRETGHQRAIPILLVLATVFQSPRAFLYDAAVYWNSAVDVSRGATSDVYKDGLLQLRGVWTPLLYLPAALAARVFGVKAAGFFVLLENGVLISAIGCFLLPRLVGLWRPTTPLVTWLSASMTWFFLVRYAPYPLTDLWAMALMLIAVLLLARGTLWALVGGGALCGVAVNVRPAYLLTVAGLVLAVLGLTRLRGISFPAGIAVALVPQLLLNVMHGDGSQPWPPMTSELTQLQGYYASYIVRYDTVAYTPVASPRLFFCDPQMARALAGQTPHSSMDMLKAFAHHPLEAGVLLAEKLGAVVHWPVSAPYYASAAVADVLFSLLVTAVAVVGFVSLLTLAGRSRPSLPQLAVGVLWAGTIVTITTSGPETRFALPLVLLGVIGSAALALQPCLGKRAAVAALVLTAVVFGLGLAGLSNPAPAGEASPSICSTQ